MKEYCKIATHHGTTMPNFPVRAGAVYGKNSGRLFVCENFAGFPEHLHVYISRDSGRTWNREKITTNNKIFIAISTVVGDNIPTLGTFNDPDAGRNKIGSRPGLREPQRHYMRFRDTKYQLRKTQYDNADRGGHPIGNNDSYNHPIHKDMVRTGVNNPLFADRPTPAVSDPMGDYIRYKSKQQLIKQKKAHN